LHLVHGKAVVQHKEDVSAKPLPVALGGAVGLAEFLAVCRGQLDVEGP
jgi:hypothetical protein